MQEIDFQKRERRCLPLYHMAERMWLLTNCRIRVVAVSCCQDERPKTAHSTSTGLTGQRIGQRRAKQRYDAGGQCDG